MPLAGFSGRALARMMIPDFVRKGFGANAALNYFRAAGGSIRRQDWLTWYREERGFMKNQPNLERIRAETIVPKAFMTETDLGRPYNYRIFYEVDYVDPETGEVETKWISYYSDEFESSGLGIEEFDRDRRREDYRSRQVIDKYTLKGVQHMRGWDY